MKNTFYPVSLLFCFGYSFFTTSCKKDNSGQAGYNHTDAVHNTLSETVILVQGGRGVTATGKDTTFFSLDSIRIKPDSTYANTYFVCTKGCPILYEDMLPATPGLIKMIIGGKEKIDTACNFMISVDPVKTYDCTADPKNYFNETDWQEAKNNKGNIIRREYAIDQADLDEAK